MSGAAGPGRGRKGGREGEGRGRKGGREDGRTDRQMRTEAGRRAERQPPSRPPTASPALSPSAAPQRAGGRHRPAPFATRRQTESRPICNLARASARLLGPSAGLASARPGCLGPAGAAVSLPPVRPTPPGACRRKNTARLSPGRHRVGAPSPARRGGRAPAASWRAGWRSPAPRDSRGWRRAGRRPPTEEGEARRESGAGSEGRGTCPPSAFCYVTWFRAGYVRS